MTSQFSLVLDLDETLVSMVEDHDLDDYKKIYNNSSLLHKSRCFSIVIKETDEETGITKNVQIRLIQRKGLEEFLSWAFTFFQNIYIWSAGINPYVLEIERCVFRKLGYHPRLTFSRDHCDQSTKYVRKPLWKIISKSKVPVRKDRIFILEDRYSAVLPEDQGNIVLISKFIPNWKKNTGFDDDELKKVQEWFIRVANNKINSVSSLCLTDGCIQGPIHIDKEVLEEEKNKQEESWLYKYIFG